MEVVMVVMERMALSWFPYRFCFKNALMQRFQLVLMGDPFASLLALKQEKSVNEFIPQFQRLAGVIKGFDEQHLMRIFLNGLREEIRAKLSCIKLKIFRK